MLSETLLIRAVKEMIAKLVSRINECDYCLTYHKSIMVDLGLNSPDDITIDYQKATILDAYKKILDNMENVTHHAFKTTDTDVDELK
jgi:AhpD family alkylhydroperoxidase